MIITYQLYDKALRDSMDWRYYRLNIEYAIKSFPMIKLVNVTMEDFTIRINTSDNNVKNRIVRAFGRALANDNEFSDFVVFRYGSYRLIAKK